MSSSIEMSLDSIILSIILITERLFAYCLSNVKVKLTFHNAKKSQNKAFGFGVFDENRIPFKDN